MITNDEIGKILRKVREDSGYTQVKMAELLTYDQSVISKVENAQMGITANLAIDWMKALGREDITVLMIRGVPYETIVNKCFTEEYKEKLKQLKSQLPSPEIIAKYNKIKKEYGF